MAQDTLLAGQGQIRIQQRKVDPGSTRFFEGLLVIVHARGYSQPFQTERKACFHRRE